jgi:class 3 adenylate cyclase
VAHTGIVQIQRSPELEAVVRRIWTAFSQGSTAAIDNMTSDDPSTRFILSADDEWFSHADHLPELMAARAAQINIDRIEFDRLEAYQLGETGWAAHELTVFLSDGESRRFRQTGTFVIEDGIWRATQLHTSRGVPAEETFGYEVASVLSELVGSLTEADSAGIAAAAGSSGLVTFMFTDIVDSTNLSHARGESNWIKSVQEHFAEIDQAVTAQEGTVVKTLGDGAMAVFPTARGAANAALAIQASQADPGIRVRIGVHTGEAVAIGSDYAGVAVAKAARVASAASGGETLVSATTRELLAPFDFTMGEERSAELKGIPGTHRLTPLQQ